MRKTFKRVLKSVGSSNCDCGWRVHILKSLEVHKQKKVSAVSSSTGNVEPRDKGFVLNLKLLFIIVDFFLKRFPPRFFTVKLVCFISFPGLSYLLLSTILLCRILT